jgi:hypothetical protein
MGAFLSRYDVERQLRSVAKPKAETQQSACLPISSLKCSRYMQLTNSLCHRPAITCP